MAYVSDGMQALFPVYLSRMAQETTRQEEYDVQVAQNEVNLNQNLETLYTKLLEIETFLQGMEQT